MSDFVRLSLRYLGRLSALAAIAITGFLGYSWYAAKVMTFDPGVSPEVAGRVVLNDVRIVTDGNAVPDLSSSVVIEDGIITQILEMNSEEGSQIAAGDSPGDTLIIDGKGQYLLPGFIDMHAHIFDRSDLALYLAHGVTTTRNMMGYPVHLRWQAESHAPGFAGAKMITSSPTLNTGSYIPFHAMVRSPEDATARVRKFKDDGYAFIKIYDGLDAEIYDAVVKEARALGLDISGHVPRAVPFQKILDDKLASIEHVEEIYYYPLDYSKSEEEHQAAATLIGESSVAISTTLTAFYNLVLMEADSESFVASTPLEWLTPISRFFGLRAAAGSGGGVDSELYERKMKALQSITRKLYDADVTLLLATDTGPALVTPGYSYHREIERLAELDIPMADILKMGTTNPARVFHEEGELGTVRRGAVADLILVAANPLDQSATLESPVMVVKGGEVYDEQALAALREAGKQHMSWPETIGVLLEQMFAWGL